MSREALRIAQQAQTAEDAQSKVPWLKVVRSDALLADRSFAPLVMNSGRVVAVLGEANLQPRITGPAAPLPPRSQE